jgi:hypothetical protein
MKKHTPTLKTLQSFKKDARKQISALKKNRDLMKYNKILNAKKRSIERNVKRAVLSEIKSANKFLTTHTKQLNDFQKQMKLAIKRKMKRNHIY